MRCAPLTARTLPLLALLLAAGCDGGGGTPAPPRLPAGFLYGTAIAGFQVEMGCPTVPAAECEAPNVDWYQFITEPELLADSGLHLQGDPPSSGPGFYELYAADIERIATGLKGNALRLSIEWGRVFPTSTDALSGYDALKQAADPKALAFYHAVFAAMKARGVKPLVTLNHYALPSWIHDTVACHKDIATCVDKGWAGRERIVREIAKYAGFVGREFGAEVDLWATLNEPLTAVVFAGFLFPTEQRTNPPGVLLKVDEAKTALVAMIEGHARMYDAVKEGDTADADGDGKAARVGIVYNLQAVAPERADDDLDVQAAKNASYLMNQVFLNGVAKGDLDEDLDGTSVHRDDLAGRLDFLGINYYARLVVDGTPSSFFPKISPLLTFNLLSMVQDYGYARGLGEVLEFARRYGVPMFITETGVDEASEPGAAPGWIVKTLDQVRRAAAAGIPVEGYFYWSLMDNYEWNHGMTFKMGLYGVDPKDPQKARTARSAVPVYARIAEAGTIPDDLAEKYLK